MKNVNKKLDVKLIRKKAEELFKNNTSKSDSSYTEGDLKKIVHELEVHQIELEMINEELVASKQREKELADNKYAFLYDFAPTGYFTLSKDGKITSLNFSGAAMLGKERHYLMNSNFNLYVAKNSKQTFQSFIDTIFKSKSKQTCEVTLLSQSNEFLHSYLSGVITEDGKQLLLTTVDISERKKAETVQSILLNISNNVSINVELEDFIKIIQQELGRIVDTSNFFLAIYNENADTISLPYYNDEKDNVTEFPIYNTLTGHVIKTGESLLINKEGIEKIDKENKFHKIGDDPEIWLGVPLKIKNKVIGAFVVQSYTNSNAYTLKDKEVLEIISNQISDSIELKQQADELIKTKEKAEESELKYKTLYDFAPIPYQSLNNEGIILDINPAWLNLLGYQENEVIGKWYGDFIHPDVLPKFIENFPTLKSCGKVGNVPFRLRKKDGNYIYISLDGHSGYNPDGSFKQTYCVFKDITEQKAVENELLNAKDLLNETGHMAKVGGWEIDLSGNTLAWTEETYQIHELSPGKEPNVSDAINYYHPDDRDMVASAVEKTIKTGIPFDFEARLITKKGNLIWVRASGKTISQNKKITGVRGSIQDITAHKQTEIDLTIAKEKAEESDRLKSAFLANMSHEIRTPMNGILGFSELLINPELTHEKQTKYINIIEQSAKRLLSTINDIIDISKIEANQVVLSFTEINIPTLLNELLEFFKPEAEKKDIKLEVSSSLSDAFKNVKTDSKLLNSILVNLIKNAIKFTEKGTIKFGCILKNNFIVFFVEDTGIGIPKGRQLSIFERFIQADLEDKAAHQGSGLGLAISKSYVEMLGGQLKLDSIVGKGSKFSFTLPLENGTKKTVKFQKQPTIKEKRDPFKKLKILIAEDDETSVIYLSEIILDKFKEIIIASNGLEALELFKKNPDIDLILMDIRLPIMNGLEVAKQIREFNKDVVIIAQTAYAMSGSSKIAKNAGCNDYISKPINKELLFGIINKYFHKEIAN